MERDEIERNLKTYAEQVFTILDPDRTQIRRNSEWLAKLDLEDVLRLTSLYTVARMMEREDFSRRFAAGKPITLAEFVYPMLQAYDSVVLKADVELGGTDQTYNLLLGRTLQEREGQEPQVCLTMPLLRGTDGERKMSKSYDNYVGLTMDPAEMFGRTMSIPDTLLVEWIDLASGADDGERSSRSRQTETDPLSAKRWLAETIVMRYHGTDAAARARVSFDRVHRERNAPEEMPAVRLTSDKDGRIWIAHVLNRAGLTQSTSEARRILKQGGVKVDGETIIDADCHLSIGKYVIQRGRRKFVRLEIDSSEARDDDDSL